MSTTPTDEQKQLLFHLGIKVEGGTQYCLSFENTNKCGLQYLIFQYDELGKHISLRQFPIGGMSTSEKIEQVFTTESNAKYIFIRFDNKSYNTEPEILKISKIQIEKGDRATEYEPFIGL